MTSRSPIPLSSLMNSTTPPPQPQQPQPRPHPQQQQLPHFQAISRSPHFMTHSASVPPFNSPPPPAIALHQQQQQQLSPNISMSPPSSHKQHLHPQHHTSKKQLLSTSSPEGIQVASKITPTRLANLLIRKGPLPIRHITAQLSIEVPQFESLSLSKQRRLIMAAMEQTDLVNNVVFEKIGWGQWAVRKVDSDYIVTEGTEGNLATSPEENGNNEKKLINVNDLRNQTNLKLGWSKKKKQQAGAVGNGESVRRESITNHSKNLHNVKLPNESSIESNAMISDDSESEDEYAISDHMESSSEEEEEEEHDSVFTFEEETTSSSINRFKKSPPPIKFAKRVPLKFSPPPIGGTSAATDSTRSRRKSSTSSSVGASSSIQKPSSSASYRHHHHHHQLLNRSRLNSIENLDNYIISSAKNSTGSINSPPPPPPPAISFSSSPINNPNTWNNGNYIHHHHSMDTIPSENTNNDNTNKSRRKSSFNESHVRSTLSSSLPQHQRHQVVTHSNLSVHESVVASDTDEEDWRAMGPESLRKNNGGIKKKMNAALNGHGGAVPRTPEKNVVSGDINEEDKSAAFALVHLMSI
ncbi:STB3 [[Candida] subhashii]|uniref:STB3 n=1 Tax=[Candida] subhashii TaxID=561895 RepID=A0A8J5UG38_9ASCO|nr:STB3 [[Candida] subhashii]KAG7662268.1 STB3 [[Candida] subhashii]